MSSFNEVFYGELIWQLTYCSLSSLRKRRKHEFKKVMVAFCFLLRKTDVNALETPRMRVEHGSHLSPTETMG